MQLPLHFLADTCYHYKNLSDANRKSSYVTPTDGLYLCDNQLPGGWYRVVGAAGTKMPTTRVPAFRCGTGWSGWLNDANPTFEDGEVFQAVCFSDRYPGCKHSTHIFVKTVDSTLSTNFIAHPVVTHATVVQTECEVIILGVVAELINRTVGTNV